MRKIGFDTEKYLKKQMEEILDNLKDKDKLYLEFGGKLIGDKHAKRVLPGFDENAKMKLIANLKEQAEIIICVYAGDIESQKIRSDYNIPYDEEVLRLLDEYSLYDIPVNSVLLTRYKNEESANIFIKSLEGRGIKVYTHEEIEGYPVDIDKIFSEDGFEKNAPIPTTKPVVIVTGPGAGSGKLTTCLSQMYHDHKAGINASYAKFETFPVWNLPLKHPVNVAYEAATIDLNDVNMIDNYHFEAYGEIAVNYNRDINMFPVLKRIIETITNEPSVYKSPTDMGVNCISDGIIDNDVVEEAARQEIIRRYFAAENDYKKGLLDQEQRRRMTIIMEENNLTPEDRTVVVPARNYEQELIERYGHEQVHGAIALELADGRIITGRTSNIMDASAAVIVNSLKALADINDQIDLLAPMILKTIQDMKTDALKSRIPTLSANELLIALSISAVTNPTAKAAYDKLDELDGCQAHSAFILTTDNEQTLKRLGIEITNDPVYSGSNFYQV